MRIIEPPSLLRPKEFTTSEGIIHILDYTLRKKIKPDYEEMFQERDINKTTLNETGIKYQNEELIELESFFNISNYSMKGKRILEVGYNDGIKCFMLKKLGAEFVKGIDIASYFGTKESDFNSKVNQQLRTHFELDGDTNVVFQEANISDFEDEPYDIIFSWDTLEHIQRPREAFQRIYKLLKPDGWNINFYTPFFSYIGGHSLCTLDFPYGHCRLSPEDFRRYITEVRPEEYDLDKNFYQYNLNRMSFKDLFDYVLGTNFFIDRIFSFKKIPEYLPFNESYLDDVKVHYPNTTMADLLCYRVTAIFKR